MGLAAAGIWPWTGKAGETFMTTATFAGPKSLNTYNGRVRALLGPLSASGPLARLAVKTHQFRYRTDLSRAVRNVDINVFETSIEAQAGWQFIKPQARLALFAGVTWRESTLLPHDPNTTVPASQLAASASVDGEISLIGNTGIAASMNVVPAAGQHWMRLQPFYKFESHWKAGASFALATGDNYAVTYAGLFMSDFELNAWFLGRVFLGGEAGGQFNLDDGGISPYVGLHIGRML